MVAISSKGSGCLLSATERQAEEICFEVSRYFLVQDQIHAGCFSLRIILFIHSLLPVFDLLAFVSALKNGLLSNS